MVEADAPLLVEILHARLCNNTIVGGSIGFEATHHVILGVVSASDFVFRQFTYTLYQFFVFACQYKCTRGEN